jgi:RimJ/RimL family protein N-acetyltransferase
MSTPIRLQCGEYLLRTLTVDDASSRYLAWLRDPDVVDTLMVQREPQTLDTVRAYIDRHDNRRGFLFGIFAEHVLHIGNYSIWHYPEDERATIGVMIGDKSYWGRGVVVATRACLLDFIFDRLACQKAQAGCLGHNAPAIFNFRRQGWTLEGNRKRQYKLQGRFVDEMFFAMFAEDWRKRRQPAASTASA